MTWLRKVQRLRLSSAILCAALVVHLVIVPLLYIGLDRVIVRTHSELFVAVADAFTKARVSEFNLRPAPPSAQALATFVEEIQASGLVAYAEFDWDGQRVRRAADPGRPIVPAEHDTFGVGDDQTYHVVAQVNSGGQIGTLRLGFDEAPITAHIAEARRLIAVSLAVYAVAVIAAALILARALSRPLGQLQQRAIRVSAGDLHEELLVGSHILELDQLGESLERMRASLVDAGAQLHRKQRLETVGTLAGGVAHEFNNILVPLTLFTESALKVLPPEHVAHPWLTRAVAAAGRAREIVSKLLMFSGRGSSEALTPMRLAPAVEEALRLFGSLRPSNIELETHIDALAEPVLAASSLVIQIVMNLCTNAYHAIPPSGGRITVRLRNARRGDRMLVELAVADTGVGMDPAIASRIFEPFFTTRNIGGGTGLGLAVVHGLVESMGAAISVTSTRGQGTEFQILFPTVNAEA